jgi:carbonic anhydrase
MLSWLYNLIIGNFCRHKWEHLFNHTVYRHEGKTQMPFDVYKIYECKKCGDVKRGGF